MKLLAIVGKKRSGKDTACDYIESNITCVSHKLAAPIKEALWTALNGKFSEDDIDGKTDYDRETILNLNKYQIQSIFVSSLNYLHNFYKLTSNYKINIAEFVDSYPGDSWSIRTFMQRLGTDLVCNKIDKNFWVRIAINTYSSYLPYKNEDLLPDYFIIPDTRQEWEIDAIRNLGGIIIHVQRDSINNPTTDNHSTEKGLKVITGDIVISNNSTLEDFYNSIDLNLRK